MLHGIYILYNNLLACGYIAFYNSRASGMIVLMLGAP